MSVDVIRKAFETDIVAMGGIPTVFENGKEQPPADGSAFEALFMLWARPENPTMGDGHYRQRGICQLTLDYPKGTGAGAASARAKALRARYRRGLSLTADGVTTIVDETPEIGSGSTVGNRFIIVVRVRFYADIFE